MEGNPNNWWINNTAIQQQHPYSLFPHHNTSSSLLLPSLNDTHDQYLPADHSWSQLLLGGLVGHEEDRSSLTNNIIHDHQQEEAKNIKQDHNNNNWDEEQVFFSTSSSPIYVNKQEYPISESPYLYRRHGHGHRIDRNEEFIQVPILKPTIWSPMINISNTTSSPRSCVTNNMLDFSYNTNSDSGHQHKDHHSSECNSTSTGGSSKRAKIQPCSIQSTIKQVVKKEKMSDRITTLHQLVSPFGKTDTASVLLEVIGYIRFLHSQIEALISSPYMGSNGSGNMRHQHSDDHHDHNESKKDLKSRGLCLVPVNFIDLQVGSSDESAADYWQSPTLGGLGGFNQ